MIVDLLLPHTHPWICYQIFQSSYFYVLRCVRKISIQLLNLLLNLNVGEVGNYCKHESCGLMQRLQCYSIVASFQGLCYCMSDHYFKNALKQKAEKQSIHNSEVFVALQYLCTGHPSRTGAVGAPQRADGPLRAVPPHLPAPSPSLPALQLQRPAPSPGGFSCASCQACWLPSLRGPRF